jgi:hypothetical protein
MSSSKNDRSLSVKGVAPESSSLMVRVMSTPARQAGAEPLNVDNFRAWAVPASSLARSADGGGKGCSLVCGSFRPLPRCCQAFTAYFRGLQRVNLA